MLYFVHDAVVSSAEQNLSVLCSLDRHLESKSVLSR